MNINRASAPATAPAAAQRTPGATASAAGSASVAKVTKAAEDFTATALNEMLAPLFATLPQDGGPFGGSQGEAAWRPMLVQEVAGAMARGGGLGITTLVAQAMLRLQETAK